MKILAVVDPFVIENSNSIKFLELTLNEVGFDTSDIEYIPAFPEELKTAPLPDTPEFIQFQKDLQDYVDEARPSLILAFGNNAICILGFVPKAAGIMKTRGKVLDYRGVKTVASISPNLVLREPVYESDFQGDMVLAFNGAQDIEFEIIDIYTPEDVAELIEEAQDTGICAYDWETTDKDPSKLTTIPVTCAFATGKQVDGKYRVYFVQFYDKLKPCFSEKEETDLISAFDAFFTQAGKEFDLVGHNIGFDDWITEEWLQHKIFGSTYDTMIEKWSYNNIRPHGLKETVAKYLGIPEYDKVMDENVKKIKERRGKILTHPDDFLSLEFAGISPVATTKTTKKNGTVTTYKWPDKTVLDKGFCAYAMLDRDTLREYNSKDALYTLLLHFFFQPRIQDEDLQVSCDFRHRLTKHIIRAEQRGLPLNIKINREYDKELEALDKQTLFQLKEMVGCVPGCKELVEEFNPNSSEQVAKVIFGATAKVPLIARKPLYREFKKESVDRIIDKVESLVYGDFSDVKDMIRSEEFDYELAKEFLDEEYRKQSKDWNSQLQFEDKLLGLGGLGYDPVSVSKKTQQPGTGKVSLLLLQNQKQTDFLNLVLMYRKVTKLRSTFIQKLFKTVDRFGISRTHYNTTGTDSARISSSGNYNAQNFPKYIRGQLYARDGYYLLSCDLKAVEVRVLAAYCKDEGLLKAIYAEDTHKTVASIIFNKPISDVSDDERASGKAQPLYSKLLTPTGWTTMRDIQIGDSIIDKAGDACRVLGKYPQGIRPVYRFFFSDHTTVDADIDHLWEVDMWKENSRIFDTVVSTRDILEYGLKRWECKSRTNESRFRIKRPQPVEFEKQWHLLDPYALGVMLGDGNIPSLTFCYGKQDTQMFDLMQAAITPRFNLKISETRKGTHIAKIYTDKSHILSSWFEKIGLKNATGEQKHIPDVYLYSSIEDRIALLQGIMDTDGSITQRNGQCDFSNKSYKFVCQVRELILSLGGSCTQVKGNVSSYTKDGRKVYCGLSHRIQFQMPGEICPFRLDRKANIYRAFAKEDPKGKYIHDVQLIGYDHTCCISVDSPSKTYITDEYTVTHNTVVFLTLYGGGPEKLAKFLNKTISEAQDVISKFLDRFPGIKNWIAEQHKHAKEEPYCVRTAWGTRRSVKNILSNDREIASKFERISCNSPIQGSAGELGLWYACEFMDFCEREGWFSYTAEDNLVNFVATVHDEITFEIHESLLSFTEEEYEEKGKIKVKQHISGAAWEVFNDAVSQTVPYPPLDEVLFEFDAAVTKCWAGEPNLHKALESSKNPEEKFVWELIGVPTDTPDKDTAEEFEDEFSEFVEPEVE